MIALLSLSLALAAPSTVYEGSLFSLSQLSRPSLQPFTVESLGVSASLERCYEGSLQSLTCSGLGAMVYRFPAFQDEDNDEELSWDGQTRLGLLVKGSFRESSADKVHFGLQGGLGASIDLGFQGSPKGLAVAGLSWSVPVGPSAQIAVGAQLKAEGLYEEFYTGKLALGLMIPVQVLYSP